MQKTVVSRQVEGKKKPNKIANTGVITGFPLSFLKSASYAATLARSLTVP